MECVQVFILIALCVATDIFHFDMESNQVTTETWLQKMKFLVGTLGMFHWILFDKLIFRPKWLFLFLNVLFVKAYHRLME